MQTSCLFLSRCKFIVHSAVLCLSDVLVGWDPIIHLFSPTIYCFSQIYYKRNNCNLQLILSWALGSQSSDSYSIAFVLHIKTYSLAFILSSYAMNVMIHLLCDNLFFNVGSEQQLGFFEDINSIKNVAVCGHRTVDSILKFILIICFCFGKATLTKNKRKWTASSMEGRVWLVLSCTRIWCGLFCYNEEMWFTVD